MVLPFHGPFSEAASGLGARITATAGGTSRGDVRRAERGMADVRAGAYSAFIILRVSPSRIFTRPDLALRGRRFPGRLIEEVDLDATGLDGRACRAGRCGSRRSRG